MSKKKNLHGCGGKGGLMKAARFFYQQHPYGTRSGIPQPIVKKAAPSVTITESGRAEQNLTGTAAASDDTRETEEMQV